MITEAVKLHRLPMRHFNPVGDGDDDAVSPVPFRPSPVEREDLPYKVELWDEAKATVEQVLAVTSNGSIG
jgi:hypothetical protein